MKYSKVVEGIFLLRPNRFICYCLINGKEEVCHVKNTGRCKELLYEGVKVILEDNSDKPNRKTKYDLISVYKGEVLINIDSQAPNNVVSEWLSINNIPFKRESKFGDSRFDFELSDNSFIEVKGVTLEKDGVMYFPDAPSLRALKHVKELTYLSEKGYKEKIFFLVQCNLDYIFRINDETMRILHDALIEAKIKGVEIIVYNSIVSNDEIRINKEIRMEL